MVDQPTHTRRRLTRNPIYNIDDTVATTSTFQPGPSRIPEQTQLVDVEFSDLDRSSDDLNSDEHATPRMQPLPKLPVPDGDLQTPAARLRALLNRVPTGNSSSSTQVANRLSASIASSVEENDMADTTHATAAPSIAQTSLRSVFSHALRPPGDTPQKQRPRRNSIDSSEVEISPRIERAKRRAQRKSLTDDELENSHSTFGHTPSTVKVRKQPVALDVLRQRFMSYSKEDMPDATGDLSDDTAELLRELNSEKHAPPLASTTLQHSLDMSGNSRLQMQSNLLEHDSEMQRIMGASAFDETGVTQQAYPSDSYQQVDVEDSNPPVSAADEPSDPPSETPEMNTDTRNSRSPLPQTSNDTPSQHDFSSTPNRNFFDSKVQGQARLGRSTSSLSYHASRPSLNAKFNARPRVVSSPKTDSSSSRASSMGQNELKERVQTLDPDYALQREREWNKPKRNLTRATSINGLTSPELERQRHHSTASTSRSGAYQLSPSVHQALRRHQSFNEDRTGSPTNSLNGKLDEDIPVSLEIVKERERNWQSPRPLWYVARPRHGSGSSFDSLSDDEDAPTPVSTNSHASPRSMAGVRQHVRKRLVSTPERPSAGSPKRSPHARLTEANLSSLTSPSHKRHSMTSLSPSPQGHSLIPPTSPLRLSTSRKHRLSLPASAKPTPAPISAPATQSTAKPGRKSFIPVPSPSRPRITLSAPITQPLFEPGEVSPTSSEDEVINQVSAASLHPPANESDSGTPQELTPRQRTISPPPVSPLDHTINLPPVDDENVQPNSDMEQPEMSLSDINAPYNSTPLDPSNHDLPSFTATPPRNGSSSVSLLASYSTPDSPNISREVPELPEPPSAEEGSESEPVWNDPPQARLFPTENSKFAGNMTAMKTPKPPGGWSETPAPRRRSRAYSDSSMSGVPVDPPRAGADAPNWTVMQTPRPPGGWLATPAAPPKQYVDQYVETDTEQEDGAPDADSSFEGDIGNQYIGLATPKSSLSKGKQRFVQTQTPAAPGGWMNTPHKSVMKVRFDPASETREFSVQTDESSILDSPGPSKMEANTSLQTPPASPDLVPTSPTKRKAGGIRMMDAFGNETKDELALDDEVKVAAMDFSSIKTPRRQPIRVLDAYGNVTEEVETGGEKSQDIVEPAAAPRKEILNAVREGLGDLVQQIHEFDRDNAPPKIDLAHIKELDLASLRSREKRAKLAQQMQDVKVKAKLLVADEVYEPSPTPRLSGFRIGSFWFLSILFLQVSVAIIIYRLSDAAKRETFLTTYYDPYNPLIHIYTFKTRELLAKATDTTPWDTLTTLLRQRDFKLFGEKATNNLFIHVTQLRSFIWQRWGEESIAAQVKAWPPT